MATAANKNLLDFSDKKVKDAFLEKLAQFSAAHYVPDQGYATHADPPTKISLPEGMTPAKGSRVLSDIAAALEEPKEITREFRYRPLDGAHAVVRVMQKFFGTSGRGIPIPTMFGSIPPQVRSIEVGYNARADVPWGRIDFAPFDGWMQLGATMNKDYGILFELKFYVPKKHEAAVNGFFNLVAEELQQHSIYKGQAIIGVEEPNFLRVDVEPSIVYTEEVMDALWTTLWGVIGNRELLLEDKRKVNKRILLHGPYGTGKSEAGRYTAKIAVEHGVTFIQHLSGQGGLAELRTAAMTARLYAPSVLFIEDVDILMGTDSPNAAEAQTQLLELFDGITSKQDGVIIVMTSNRAAEFSKGMLRAGRVDRMIEIGPLDRDATERMIRKVIGEERIDPETDFDAVWEAMEGFEPAFVRTTFDQAAESALIRKATELREKGLAEDTVRREAKKYQLGTNDFVTAARLLRPQHDLHASKKEGERVTTFDTAFSGLLDNWWNSRHLKQEYDEKLDEMVFRLETDPA